MSPPFIPTGVDHLVLWVSDLDAASQWYQRIVGCRPGFEYREIGMVHLWHGPVLIGLWDDTDPGAAYAAGDKMKGENVHHIALGWQGASEESVRRHLADNQVEIVRERRQVGARGYGLALYFRDPWGNLIELKGPPEPVPDRPDFTT